MRLNIQPKTSGDVITSADFNAIVSAVNANESAIEQLDSTKQDTLIGSGTGQNIKTVGGVSILGTGDISVGDDAPIQSISVNGNDVPPDENGNVAITAYQKQQTGIPESDLSEGVQTKLNDDLAKRVAMYGKDVMPTDSSNFDWTLISSDTEYRIKAKSGVTLSGEVVIPYEYNGKPVTQLWQGLFKNQTGITSIIIPNSITSMSSSYNGGVFQGCTSLTSIDMPDGIEQTDARYVFYGCTGLKYIKLSKGIKYLGESYFSGCSSLEVVEIPDGVLGVGINVGGAVNELTFANCPNLKKVIIPDSVTAFGTSLFKYSPNIVVYCNKGSAAESYCKTYNVPYTYNDFKDKQDKPNIVTQTAPSSITVADNTIYYLTDVSNLSISYPSGHFECLLQIETASSGEVRVAFGNGTKRIGDIPNLNGFGNSKTWEISIRDKIVVCQEVKVFA